ncbi:MAG: hypothetical protein ACJAT2_002840 [Bacteriovoracaceae bacterium]|jgi:hypothetical protein
MKKLLILTLLFCSTTFAEDSKKRKPASEVVYVLNAVICGSTGEINKKILEIKKTGSTELRVSHNDSGQIVRFGKHFTKTQRPTEFDMTPVYPTTGTVVNCYVFSFR